jgi:hypothetical protein
MWLERFLQGRQRGSEAVGDDHKTPAAAPP